PAMYLPRDTVVAGGLMAYGPDFVVLFRRSADYVHKILKGVRPADIPIVASVIADPVGSGLVTSLNHTGGNITGLSTMLAELGAKRLQLLRETMPRVSKVAVLRNPGTPWHIAALEDLKRAAPSWSIELTETSVQKPEQFSLALSAVKHSRADALYVLDD